MNFCNGWNNYIGHRNLFHLCKRHPMNRELARRIEKSTAKYQPNSGHIIQCNTLDALVSIQSSSEIVKNFRTKNFT